MLFYFAKFAKFCPSFPCFCLLTVHFGGFNFDSIFGIGIFVGFTVTFTFVFCFRLDGFIPRKQVLVI